MLSGYYEFRGYEEKTSGKGNRYINLNMEDCDTGSAVRFYVNANTIPNCNPPIASLKKGDVIEVKCNYHQGFGGSWQADFVGFGDSSVDGE